MPFKTNLKIAGATTPRSNITLFQKRSHSTLFKHFINLYLLIIHSKNEKYC